MRSYTGPKAIFQPMSISENSQSRLMGVSTKSKIGDGTYFRIDRQEDQYNILLKRDLSSFGIVFFATQVLEIYAVFPDLGYSPDGVTKRKRKCVMKSLKIYGNIGQFEKERIDKG